MDFGRAADQREIAQFQEEHVGRRIDEPQRPIEIHRRQVEIRFKALARDELENVAGGDELLARADHGFEFLLAGVAAGLDRFDLQQAVERRNMQRAVEDFHHGGDFAAGLGIGVLWRGRLRR